MVPQFTVEADAALSALVSLLSEVERNGTRVSYSDVFVAACARALRTNPQVNASFQEDAIVQHRDIHVAFAVALDDGLIAPTILNADCLRLTELSAERARLTDGARAGKLTLAETLSATFTISNLGSMGIRRFRALVIPPQAAILAIGASTADDLCSLSLSCDHRVLDGVPGARFLMQIVRALEQPDWLHELL